MSYVQVVEVYAATSAQEDEKLEEFYEEVYKIMSENKSYYKIVIGDFNAKVGGHRQGDGTAGGQRRGRQRTQRKYNQCSPVR